MARKKQKIRYIEGSELLAAGAGAAATPSLINAQRARQFVNLDKNSKNLVIFSEGGKYNTGGAGHASAASAIAEAYRKKHPTAKIKILNYG